MKKLLVYTFFLMVLSTGLSAKHIVGGDVSYKCLGIDVNNNEVSFEITAKIYRDNKSGGAEFDDVAEFGLYRGSGSNWTFIDLLKPSKGSDVELEVINPNPCLTVPDNIGVDEAIYIFRIKIPISNQSYMLVHQRCCRNESITNIIAPGKAGVAFSIEITPEAQKTCNNSPVFNGFPPILICADDPLIFDHSASDVEGDQIVYSFCNPQSAGGSRGGNGGPGGSQCDGVTPNPEDCLPPFSSLQYKAPHTPLNPISGSPMIMINSITGIITGVPTVQGQYVVGVCAKEYRNGVLIGEIRRDFQINVAICNPLVYADIESGIEVSEQKYEIISCGENEVHITNASYTENNINEYYWEFDINGTIDTFDTRHVDVMFPSIGTYTGLMILNPGTICSDTADLTVVVYPGIDADFSFDYDTCVYGPVDFTDLTVSGSDTLTDWSWFMSIDTLLNDINPSYLFSEPGVKKIVLIATDINNCMDTMIKSIDYFPSPNFIDVEPSSFIGCAPGSVFFDNLSFPIDSTYNLIWNFGDGTIDNGHKVSPRHTYTIPGAYSVDLKVISPVGCEIVETFPSWITIKNKPSADFTYTPEDPSVFNNKVSFINESQGGIGYNWLFGGAGVSFDENPIFTFQDTGVYNVRLIVKNDEHCTDTVYSELYVIAPVLLHFPNAFTPNNDALNDDFRPKGYFAVIRNYKLNIFNRWGERIFETTEPKIGWNGQKDNSGELSPMGVYIFQASYLDEYGKQKTVEGHVNLIR